jgi:triosephosphate isomerase
MRIPVMAGNWKMYKTTTQTRAYMEDFCPRVKSTVERKIVMCPTFVNLQEAVAAAQGTSVEIGGQNLFWAKEGAYTGEVSADMLRAAGCRWAIVAHSERRQYFCETDEIAFRKTCAALEGGLTPIVCIGEQLSEREAGHTNQVLETQFRGSMSGLTPEQFGRIVIAYEPVWAIGTGKTATPEIAEDAHRVIRAQAAKAFGEAAAAGVRILYGGSVKSENVKALMAQEDIDGALVGGASLDPQTFAAIVNF